MSDDLESLFHAQSVATIDEGQWQQLPKGRIDIRIDRRGEWFYRGSVISRKPLVKLLASQLHYFLGEYYLVAPEQRLKIAVDDLPFVVCSVSERQAADGEQLLLTLNIDDEITLGEAHPLKLLPLPDAVAELIPAVEVRAGLWARFSRQAYYQLIDIALSQQQESSAVDSGDHPVPDADQLSTEKLGDKYELMVMSHGQRFIIGYV